MYNLSNFEPYTLRKYLGALVILAWSKQNGYQFMDVLDRFKAIADNLDFIIIAVESSK